MVADPRQVVHPEGRPCDNAEAPLAQPRDREVALDAAAVVEHLRVGERADPSRHPVVGEAFEKLGRACAADLDLRERREIEDRGSFATGRVLDADGRRPQPAGPPVGAQRLVAMSAVRLEPVHALPARLLAKRRAHISQARIDRRDAKRPAGASFMARIFDVVVRRVHLVRASKRVVAAQVGPAETTRVHLPRVKARLSIHDPFRDQAAHSACPCEPVGAKTCRDPEAPDLARTEDELVVRREGLGTVDQPNDFRVL